jgi:hypothetical protein
MRALLFLLLLWPLPAQAGPWPRPQGDTYVMLGAESGDDERGGVRGGWSSLYLERGGPWRLTLGLDGGARPARRGARWAHDDARWRAFVRVPLDDGTGDWRFAAEAGSGVDLTLERPIPRLHLGLSAGRGFSTGMGGGWIVGEARVAWAESASERWNVSLKAGLKPLPRDAVEIGLHAERSGGGDLFATFGPTWQRSLTERLSGRIGLSVTERGRGRISLGLVAEF